MTGARHGLIAVFVAGFIAGAVSNVAAASDPAPPTKTANSAQPMKTPDARSRAIPELVCSADRLMTIDSQSLSAISSDEPFRLRLRGNFLYTGQTAGTEKFSGTISRNDRRRWVTATSILILDEELVIGSFTDVQANTVTIRSLICEALIAPSVDHALDVY